MLVSKTRAQKFGSLQGCSHTASRHLPFAHGACVGFSCGQIGVGVMSEQQLKRQSICGLHDIRIPRLMLLSSRDHLGFLVVGFLAIQVTCCTSDRRWRRLHTDGSTWISHRRGTVRSCGCSMHAKHFCHHHRSVSSNDATTAPTTTSLPCSLEASSSGFHPSAHL